MPLLREPLLQFLLLGAVLFALFGIFGKKDEAAAPAKIVISAQRIATLADGFTRTWRRPPTGQELQGLVDDYVRDEVLYREGRAAGLDRDDVIIRRRVRQKMEFLAEDMAAVEASEEQLAGYLASHPERFRIQERLTFQHVFLSATRRGDAIEKDAKQVATLLADANVVKNVDALGDPFLRGEEFRSLSRSEIASSFGENFAKHISAMQQGGWQGPIASDLGLHFVLINERTPGSLPPLDAVRQIVQKEWLNDRRLEAEQTLYRKLRDRYEIVIEAPPNKTAQSEAGQ